MLKPKHHIIIYPFFKRFTRFLLKRNFKSVQIEGSFQDTGEPILVIANHISWWDGFWMMYLNLKIFHRKFHFMMLEEQLKKHWYFQYSGAYSIKKKSRSVLDSLDITTKLLEDKCNMVFVFPQGKIHSLYNDNIKFEKGIERVINTVKNDVQVVCVASFLDYFRDSKPNLYLYLKQYSAQDLKGKLVEKQYDHFYRSVLKQQKAKSL